MPTNLSSSLDMEHMCSALSLAHLAIGLSDPNPRVGCVITRPDGTVISKGHTHQAGGPHAEAAALQAAYALGLELKGATAYVTLEPCSHFGRTPPCCEALIRAGVSRVVVATLDPNPLVSGQGVQRLRSAGIQVDVGVLEDEAREINIGFLSRMIRSRPWVRMKVAGSLDGSTALANGQSQWITGPEARLDGRRWRMRAGAILTGIGTVLADDPRLDVRDLDAQLVPLRVVVDSKLSTPVEAKLLDAPGRALIASSAPADGDTAQALRTRGAEVLTLPAQGGRVDLTALVTELARRGINELHVEAGATLNGALLAADLVDEFLIYLAPKLLGSGRGMWNLPTLERLEDATQLVFRDVTMVGDDLRIVARPPGREQF